MLALSFKLQITTIQSQESNVLETQIDQQSQSDSQQYQVSRDPEQEELTVCERFIF